MAIERRVTKQILLVGKRGPAFKDENIKIDMRLLPSTRGEKDHSPIDSIVDRLHGAGYITRPEIDSPGVYVINMERHLNDEASGVYNA